MKRNIFVFLILIFSITSAKAALFSFDILTQSFFTNDINVSSCPPERNQLKCSGGNGGKTGRGYSAEMKAFAKATGFRTNSNPILETTTDLGFFIQLQLQGPQNRRANVFASGRHNGVLSASSVRGIEALATTSFNIDLELATSSFIPKFNLINSTESLLSSTLSGARLFREVNARDHELFQMNVGDILTISGLLDVSAIIERSPLATTGLLSGNAESDFLNTFELDVNIVPTPSTLNLLFVGLFVAFIFRFNLISPAFKLK